MQQTILWIADYRMALPLALALSIVATLGFAIVSWKFIEEPAMRFMALRRRNVPNRAQPGSAS